MALGLSGSKGGIDKDERIVSEGSVDLFKDLVELKKGDVQDGNRTFR